MTHLGSVPAQTNEYLRPPKVGFIASQLEGTDNRPLTGRLPLGAISRQWRPTRTTSTSATTNGRPEDAGNEDTSKKLAGELLSDVSAVVAREQPDDVADPDR